MSMKYLGRHFDIHGGGLDLVFPHHENELVQSESYSGETFASYWLHNGLLTKDGRKISKSDPDTIVLMSDLLQGPSARTPSARSCSSSHYRRPIDYGPNRLDEIDRGLQTFYRAFERFAELTGERSISSRPRRAGATSSPTARPCSGRSPSTASGSSTPWTTTSTPAGRSASSSRSCTPSTGSPTRARRLRRPGAPTSSPSTRRAWSCSRSSARSSACSAARRPPRPGRHALTDGLLGLLVELRTRLRKEKNFAMADEIRNRLAELGRDPRRPARRHAMANRAEAVSS